MRLVVCQCGRRRIHQPDGYDSRVCSLCRADAFQTEAHL